MAHTDIFEMFRTGCAFISCADLCMKEYHTKELSWLSNTVPAAVNAAFACEVFLKMLLHFNQIDYDRIHKLNVLFEKLPSELKEKIQQNTIQRYGRWTDIGGRSLLLNISNAFVEWRYIYEHDWSKSAAVRIDVSFLLTFGKVLEELCSAYMEVVL